jgi:hypothetical protein
MFNQLVCMPQQVWQMGNVCKKNVVGKQQAERHHRLRQQQIVWISGCFKAKMSV